MVDEIAIGFFKVFNLSLDLNLQEIDGNFSIN